MDVKCEITDYSNENNNSMVIVSSVPFKSNTVRITAGDMNIEVDGEELTQAIKRCIRSTWPY